jgi:hypothetical protein
MVALRLVEDQGDPADWRGPDKLRVVSLINDYSRFATFGSTTIEGLVF